MTSAKKYGIQEFTTKLPDFLLQFVDANIRNDTYGALRSTHLSHKLEDLIPELLPCPANVWLYADPLGTDHLIISDLNFNQLFKPNQSLPKKDKQLLKTTPQTYLLLEFEPRNILSTMLKDQQLKYLSRTELITMDEIRLKCEANLYFQPEEVIKDITQVIAWNQVYRASSRRSFIHLSNFYGKFLQLISKRKFITKFYEKKNKDFQELQKLELHFKLPVTSWPFIPQKFRQYKPLEAYLPTPANRTEKIEARLKSQKVPVECPENCVCYRKDLKSNEEFCNYSLADVWQSECPNRKSKIECNHTDHQKTKNCRNSQIKNKKRKKVKQPNMDNQNFQIQQFMAWGIDLFTRNVIYNCLPEVDIIGFIDSERNAERKNEFIEMTIQKALNFLGEKGFDMNEACQFIIQNGPAVVSTHQNGENKKRMWKAKAIQKIHHPKDDKLFSQLDVEFATNLLKNKNYADFQFPGNDLFRIHTKGKGAKCTAKLGLKRGTFIVEYFGEIYEPWRWYERQDFIKEVLKKKKLKQVIPQFYNIYLQKHKDQPLGYDMLVVDPIKKGNFSSRFSHSCTPNCGTVSTISDGKYVIGMYSIKDISYGQQLTFDYCSMTESSYQHTNSICLCGTKQCRGNYLQLANNKNYNNLMDYNSCFHYRNSLMLRSLGALTEEEWEVCAKFNIKGGILANLPHWMVKWCAIVLQSIEKEGEVYRQQLQLSWTTEYPWENKNQTEEQKQEKILLYAQISKNDLINLRVQNLITTVDKIKYYLQSIDDQQPPLFYESKEKICEVLIENYNKDSIIVLLEDELTNEKLKQEIQLIQVFLNRIKAIDIDLSKVKQSNDLLVKEELINQKLFYFRLCCLCVSHQILLKSNGSQSNRALLADVIYFYAFTHTYFKPHEYKTHTSQEIKVTLREILGESCPSKYSDKTRKRYTSPCVWGQMVSWFKQTIVNPEASLSQDRRGTLSYPLINSILKSTYPFQRHQRTSFLKTIREKPASSWPPAPGCELSYKNPYKCYGTILFESVHNRQAFKKLSKQCLLSSTLDVINASLKEKLNLFKQVELIVENVPQNSEMYDILDKLSINFDAVPVLLVPEELQKKQPEKKARTEKKIPSEEDEQNISSNQVKSERDQLKMYSQQE